MKRISIVGFGKIGQAIAAHILKQGISITAVDINTELQTSLKNDRFVTNEPGVGDILAKAYGNQKLAITADYSSIKGSDAIIIAIPLLIDEHKKILDVPFVDTIKNIAPFTIGKIPVIIETSIPVGFSRNCVVPAFESAGKQHGVDILVAHSPERIKSGTMLEQLSQIPKIIGGVTKEATEASFEIYKLFFEESLLYKVESAEAAEMIKLAGMVYRDVNIALSNQLAQFADAKGIHFTELISLINTDREAGLLQPGIGVGGHCTPVYPYFMIENFRESGLDFTLAAQSRAINDSMVEHAVSSIKDKVKRKKALLLGLSFRPNVKEDAMSVTYRLNETLIKHGFDVTVHDAEYSTEEIMAKGFTAVSDIYESKVEVVFLVTMHKEYFQLDFEKLAKNGVRFFIDGRNSINRDDVEKSGISYTGIGR